MDPASIITQVSPDDEQLSNFPPERGGLPTVTTKKPRHKGFLNTLLCCFRSSASSAGATNQVVSEDNSEYSPQRVDGEAGEKGNVPYSCAPRYISVAVSPSEISQFQASQGQGRTLLPPVKATDANKICLVIDLDETLVHSSFKPISNADFVVPVEIEGTVHQVYVLKRPYVEEFLRAVGDSYECVLFTASLAKYADPVADLLDKWGVFRARLFRESCAFYRGNYVKDLGRLGRDLHRVVIIDNSPASYMFHPDNAVPVGSWFDDMNDTELHDLIPFFERLARVDDVYAVLRNANIRVASVSNGQATPNNNAPPSPTATPLPLAPSSTPQHDSSS